NHAPPITLSTPTTVFMPFNSQRTPSHTTQLYRSEKNASPHSIVSNRTAQQQDDQNDSQRDPVNCEGRESSRPHPAHEPRNHHERDDERNNESDREDDPLMRVDGERRKIAFVYHIVAGFQRLVEVVQRRDNHRRHRKKK